MATKHSTVVGGSTAKLRLLCNASIDESKKVPRETSIYAANGTALHTVVERAIDGDMSDDDVLKTFEGMDYGELLSDPNEIEEFGHHVMTREALKSKALPALTYFDEVVPPSATFWLEEFALFKKRKRSPFGDDFEIYDEASGEYGGGSPDVLFDDSKNGGPVGLIDWKFGDGWIVDPEENEQFMFYLALGIHMGLLPVVDEYEAHVFQPAEKLQAGEYGRFATYTYEQIETFILDLRDAIEAERRHEPGVHCKGCKGKIACPVYKKWLARVEDTDVQTLDNRGLAEELDFVDTLKAYIKEVEAAALRNAQNGVTIPGWKLEIGEGNRAFKDEKSAGPALGRLGISAKDRQVTKLISAPQALKKLKDNGVKPKQIERFEKRHVFRPETAERLVRAKDGEDGSAFTKLANAMEAI